MSQENNNDDDNDVHDLKVCLCFTLSDWPIGQINNSLHE
jgi:hypothetical protein